MRSRSRSILAMLAGAALVGACATAGSAPSMTFFVTSVGLGKGGDLGGLAGADAHCQALATAAGAGNKTWHAYLSTASVNARDRIGKGPWYNARRELVASNVDELHTANKITKQSNLTEKGEMFRGFGDPTPNQHDILTGSTADGRVAQGATCNDWTSSGAGSAMVGHGDLNGTNPDPVLNRSWNSSHKTPGCSPQDLARVGGAGLFYCFAVD